MCFIWQTRKKSKTQFVHVQRGKVLKVVHSRCVGPTVLVAGSSVPESPGGRKLWNCSNKKQTGNPVAQEARSLNTKAENFEF